MELFLRNIKFDQNMAKQLWYDLANLFSKMCRFIFPINETYIELLKTLLTEEEANFLLIFEKPNLNINEIKEKINLDEETLKQILDRLLNKGIITGIPSRSTGIMVYTLMPLFPGIFEYSFMKGETTETQKQLARIFEKMFSDASKFTQTNYNEALDRLKTFTPLDRIVPVEEQIEVQQEQIIPYEEVEKLIESSDTIGVAHCYCRHFKNLLDEQCNLNASKLNCLQLGKNAQFAIKYGFSKQISKEEALEILQEAEDQGLVHKAIHVNQNPEKPEAAICNCCKCCCETFQMYYRGMAPFHSLTSYVSIVDKDLCVGCETCVNICPVEAPELIDTISVINEERCIGCGVCAHHCPEEAIRLERTGPRIVFVPPPKIKQI